MPDTSKYKQKAQEALDRGNYDYAIKLLQDILLWEPDNVEMRKQLRMAANKNVKKKGINKG